MLGGSILLSEADNAADIETNASKGMKPRAEVGKIVTVGTANAVLKSKIVVSRKIDLIGRDLWLTRRNAPRPLHQLEGCLILFRQVLGDLDTLLNKVLVLRT